jgi:hypothetical protein
MLTGENEATAFYLAFFSSGQFRSSVLLLVSQLLKSHRNMLSNEGTFDGSHPVLA